MLVMSLRLSATALIALVDETPDPFISLKSGNKILSRVLMFDRSNCLDNRLGAIGLPVRIAVASSSALAGSDVAQPHKALTVSRSAAICEFATEFDRASSPKMLMIE